MRGEIVVRTRREDSALCEDLLGLLGVMFATSKPGIWTAGTSGGAQYRIRATADQYLISWVIDEAGEGFESERLAAGYYDDLRCYLEVNLKRLGWHVVIRK